jgi:hypothetical protein
MKSEILNQFKRQSHPLLGYWHQFFGPPGDYFQLDPQYTPLEQILGQIIYCQAVPLPPINEIPELPINILHEINRHDKGAFLILHGSQLYNVLTHPSYLRRGLQDTQGNFLNDIDIAIFSELDTLSVNRTIARCCMVAAKKDRQRVMKKGWRREYAQRILVEEDPSSLSAPKYVRVKYKYWPYAFPEEVYSAYDIHHVDGPANQWQDRFWSLYLQFHSNRLGNGGLLMNLNESGEPEYYLYSPFPIKPGLPHQVYLSHPDHLYSEPQWAGVKAARFALYAVMTSLVAGEPANIDLGHVLKLRDIILSRSWTGEERNKIERRLNNCEAQANKLGQPRLFKYYISLLGLN